MTTALPTKERSYYEYLPHLEHGCGDIWVGLPTLGLLPQDTVSGLVITPACDLSNRKTETITYLPILSISSYFATGAEIPDIAAKVRKLCAGAKFAPTVQWRDDQRRAPAQNELQRDIASISQRLEAPRISKADQAALQRALAGFLVLSDPLGPAVLNHLALLYGAEWGKLLTRIVSNSYSNDIHFLPADGQNTAFSGVSSHSVVLFRYPITIPSALLDLAMAATPDIWREIVAEHETSLPVIRHFGSALPFKSLTLKASFRADLLTRYIALYIRIGSPDFSSATISRLVAEMRG